MSDQQVALVTGTSSGIGLHTAVGLARAGLHVVATMRDTSRAGELLAVARTADVELEVLALDVVDHTAGADCVTQVLAEHGRLDVLVNNAGRGAVGTLEQLTIQDVREQLELNYVAVAALTRQVLPTMRAAGRGRIVTVTSVGGAVGQPFADAYCGAKFAVEGLMQSLAPVVAQFGVQVAVVEPAAVATGFVGAVDGVGLSPDPDDAYGGLLAGYLRHAAGSFAAAQSAEGAAEVVVQACVTDAPRFRWQTSPTAAAFVGLSLADLDGSRVLDQTTSWLV